MQFESCSLCTKDASNKTFTFSCFAASSATTLRDTRLYSTATAAARLTHLQKRQRVGQQQHKRRVEPLLPQLRRIRTKKPRRRRRQQQTSSAVVVAAAIAAAAATAALFLLPLARKCFTYDGDGGGGVVRRPSAAVRRRPPPSVRSNRCRSFARSSTRVRARTIFLIVQVACDRQNAGEIETTNV